MIEIVFGESACCTLKMAQHFGEGEYRGGGAAAIAYDDGSKLSRKEAKDAGRALEKAERLAWENATPLGGEVEDVYGFNLSLSVGDIAEHEPDSGRKQTLKWLYGIFPFGEEVAQEMLQGAKDNLKTVMERAAADEPIRIWYSSHPDELCGLYWFLAQLDQLDQPCEQVYLVKLPEWTADENDNTVLRAGCNELTPEEWHQYLPLQIPAPLTFQGHCASHWRTLQKENAPLRAVLNGQLVSARQTLYDDFILREIEKEDTEFHEAMLIGRVLGAYRLGISDTWIALRIEEMICEGKLEVATEARKDDPIYHRTLRKRVD